MTDEPTSKRSPATDDRPAVAAAPSESVEAVERRLRRTARALRFRILLFAGLGLAALAASGPVVVFAPKLVALFVVPVLLAVSFVAGFALAGRLLALSLTRHHEKLRNTLADQQERTRKVLVSRWLTLDENERSLLRARFPDVDWSAIDDLAGTAAEGRTKH